MILPPLLYLYLLFTFVAHICTFAQQRVRRTRVKFRMIRTARQHSNSIQPNHSTPLHSSPLHSSVGDWHQTLRLWQYDNNDYGLRCCCCQRSRWVSTVPLLTLPQLNERSIFGYLERTVNGNGTPRIHVRVAWRRSITKNHKPQPLTIADWLTDSERRRAKSKVDQTTPLHLNTTFCFVFC